MCRVPNGFFLWRARASKCADAVHLTCRMAMFAASAVDPPTPTLVLLHDDSIALTHLKRALQHEGVRFLVCNVNKTAYYVQSRVPVQHVYVNLMACTPLRELDADADPNASTAPLTSALQELWLDRLETGTYECVNGHPVTLKCETNQAIILARWNDLAVPIKDTLVCNTARVVYDVFETHHTPAKPSARSAAFKSSRTALKNSQTCDFYLHDAENERARAVNTNNAPIEVRGNQSGDAHLSYTLPSYNYALDHMRQLGGSFATPHKGSYLITTGSQYAAPKRERYVIPRNANARDAFAEASRSNDLRVPATTCATEDEVFQVVNTSNGMEEVVREFDTFQEAKQWILRQDVTTHYKYMIQPVCYVHDTNTANVGYGTEAFSAPASSSGNADASLDASNTVQNGDLSSPDTNNGDAYAKLQAQFVTHLKNASSVPLEAERRYLYRFEFLGGDLLYIVRIDRTWPSGTDYSPSALCRLYLAAMQQFAETRKSDDYAHSKYVSLNSSADARKSARANKRSARDVSEDTASSSSTASNSFNIAECLPPMKILTCKELKQPEVYMPYRGCRKSMEEFVAFKNKCLLFMNGLDLAFMSVDAELDEHGQFVNVGTHAVPFYFAHLERQVAQHSTVDEDKKRYDGWTHLAHLLGRALNTHTTAYRTYIMQQAQAQAQAHAPQTPYSSYGPLSGVPFGYSDPTNHAQHVHYIGTVDPTAPGTGASNSKASTRTRARRLS